MSDKEFQLQKLRQWNFYFKYVVINPQNTCDVSPPPKFKNRFKAHKKIESCNFMLQCLKKQTNKQKNQTKTMGGGGHQRKKISILQIVFLLINITLVTST